MAACSGAGRVLRQGFIAFLAIAVLSVVLADHAEARRRKHHKAHGRGSHAVGRIHSPIYSAIIVDAKTGKILHAEDPDGVRHPASITKVMTLYMLFEQMEAGRLSLSTPLEVSEEAAAKPPTKLGLRPGSTITVEDAIKGVITKSANDAATVIAENIGGDEERFAAAMTRKARALGMKNTVYRNASGLPDAEQVTTARDLAILGRAIQERFPRYYRYFSTRSFAFHGRTVRGHNRLMERLEGVDGIKTGYTNASGYNLLSSVKRDGRQLVGVVMGGHTGAWRDARMQQLLMSNIEMASAGPSTSSVLAESGAAPAAPTRMAVAVKAQVVGPRRTASDSDAEDKPSTPLNLVSTQPARSGATTGVASTMPLNAFVAMPARQQQPVPFPTANPNPRPGILGTLPASRLGDKTGSIDTTQRAVAAETQQDLPPAPAAAPVAVKTTAAAPTKRAGEWSIQIGAFPSLNAAQDSLSKAKGLGGKTLASAQDYTEEVKVGANTLVRGRFAGFDQHSADAACKALKARSLGCIPIRN